MQRKSHLSGLGIHPEHLKRRELALKAAALVNLALDSFNSMLRTASYFRQEGIYRNLHAKP